MCRLFGMTSAPARTNATFWLLDAPDSLVAQSHREPDGTGLGSFDGSGTAVVERWPVAAYQDSAFISEARKRTAATFVAHIRYASDGAVAKRNTHPFCQRNRIMAHNGVIGGLAELDRELGDYRALVHGETDSERFFALITRYVDDTGGDVGEAITRAARWVADNLPLYALNVVLATATQLWALRYPDTHQLFVIPRRPGGQRGDAHLHHVSPAGTMQVHSENLAEQAAVVVASERMDDDPAWRPLSSGELLHVDGDGRISTTIAVPDAPARPLTLGDLAPSAAASQAAGKSS